MKRYAGYTLLLTGDAGRQGAKLLVQAERDQMEEYFSPHFLKRFFEILPSHEPDRRTAEEKFHIMEGLAQEEVISGELLFFIPVLEGGIFTTLWDVCEQYACGVDVQIADIPIRQETIEICMFRGMDPYYTQSGYDSVLFATKNPEKLRMRLMEEKISSSVIGFTTEKADRMLRQGEQIRYLNRPEKDAWITYQMTQGGVIE